jgi:antirestriction protein ArdC
MSSRCGRPRRSDAYTHSLWGTYKQFQSLDAQVRKGEKAALVIFYKEYDVEPDPQHEDDDGRRRVAKASWVFNVAQVDGYSIGEPLPPLPPLQRNARAEAFVAATGAEIRIGGESAYYRPSTDHIQMPDENLFQKRTANSVHRTGTASSRTNSATSRDTRSVSTDNSGSVSLITRTAWRN